MSEPGNPAMQPPTQLPDPEPRTGGAASPAEPAGRFPAVYLGHGAPTLLDDELWPKELAGWVLIANLIAWPVAYYFMNGWLHGFAYRTPMNAWMYLLAGGMAMVIALATVSFQAIKAAAANPVESLRYE